MSHDRQTALALKWIMEIYAKFGHYGRSTYEARMRLDLHHHESLTGFIYWLLCLIVYLAMMCLIRNQQSSMTPWFQGLMLSFVLGRTWILELWLAAVVAISVRMFYYATDQILALLLILFKLKPN